MTPLDTLKAVVERAATAHNLPGLDMHAAHMADMEASERVMAFLTSDTAVEELARLINPSAWRVMDHELERLKRHRPNGGYDPFTDKASMALATSILSLIASRGLAG